MNQTQANERNTWATTRNAIREKLLADTMQTGFTQTEMALLCGVSPRTVKHRESDGVKWITITEALALQRLLQFDGGELFGMLFAAKTGQARLPMI